MKRVIQLLPVLLILASSSALAGSGHGPRWGDYFGYGPYGYGPGGGQGGSTLEVDVETENQPFMRWRHRFDFVLDPVDSSATSDTFPGAAEDSPGRGEWGPSDAGEVQPGNGAPHSGTRPPH